MHVFGMWRVLCVLGFIGASLCVNEVEFEGNFAESYDNEISQDKQEGEFCLCVLLSNFSLCLFQQMAQYE